MSHSRDLARIARQGVITVDTAQNLRDLPIYDGVYPVAVNTSGALAAGDGGGGLWRWDATNTEADDIGTVLLPTGHTGQGRWVNDFDVAQGVSSAWFGVTDDPGATIDQTVSLQSWLDAAARLGTRAILQPGTFGHKGLTFRSWQKIEGQSETQSSILKLQAGAAADAICLSAWGYQNDDIVNDNKPGLIIRDIEIDVGYDLGNTQPTQHGLLLQSWNTTIHNVSIRGGAGCALIGTGVTKNGTASSSNFVRHHITDCQFNGGFKGVVFGDSGRANWTDGYMTGCYFSNVPQIAIGSTTDPQLMMRNAGGWRVIGNVFNYPPGTGLSLEGGRHYIVSKNRIDGYGNAAAAGEIHYGIRIKSGTDADWLGAVVEGNQIIPSDVAANCAEHAAIFVAAGGTNFHGSYIISNNQLVATPATTAGNGIYVMRGPQGIFGLISNNLSIGFNPPIRIAAPEQVRAWGNLLVDFNMVPLEESSRRVVSDELFSGNGLRLSWDEDTLEANADPIRTMLSLGYSAFGANTVDRGVGIAMGGAATDQKTGHINWVATSNFANSTEFQFIPSPRQNPAAGVAVTPFGLRLQPQTSAPPATPGTIVYADGATWDPGQGAGIYALINGAWKKMSA